MTSDSENSDSDGYEIDLSKQFKICFCFYLIKNTISCSAYTYKKINILKLRDLCYESFESNNWVGQKKFRLRYILCRVPSEANNKLLCYSIRKMSLPSKYKTNFHPIDEFKLHNKVKRWVEYKLKDNEDSLNSDTEEENYGTDFNDSDDEYNKVPCIDKGNLNSGDFDQYDPVCQLLSDEMFYNIEMLKSINFLRAGKFSIWKDRVILDNPCCFAFGDWIENRNEWYYSHDHRFGHSWKVSRIAEMDILDFEIDSHIYVPIANFNDYIK